MRRLAFVPVLALLLALTAVAPAYAQGQMPQPCAPYETDSRSMAGVYIAEEHRVRLDIGPCGSVTVLWASPSGTHRAFYNGVEPMAGGGFIARVTAPDPVAGSLDGRNVIGVKPAEVGWIQVITASAFADDFRIYRLLKVR